jgi:hypothetical protein
MASWGLRPFVMLVFICVIILIVFFSDVLFYRSPIPPTELPPLTLVLRTITESPPLDIALPVVLILVDDFPLLPTLPPQSPTSDLISDINPPTCYEMPHDGIQCLGLIYNPYDEALENVHLRMLLWNQDAELIAQSSFTLPQKYIPPYSLAPYQAIFTQDSLRSGDFGGAKVDFIHATLTPYIPHTIQFEETKAEWHDNVYRLSGYLQNDLDQELSARLVVSMTDGDGRLMGFRVIEVGIIESGAKHPLEIDLMPLWVDETLAHSVYIEMIADKED